MVLINATESNVSQFKSVPSFFHANTIVEKKKRPIPVLQMIATFKQFSMQVNAKQLF